MDAQRLVGIATIAVLALSVLGFVAVVVLGADPEPVEVEPTPRSLPRPAGTVAPSTGPGPMVRRAIPPPAGQERPKPPTTGAPSPSLSTEEWRDYNQAVHDVATQARDECLREWTQEQDLGKVEIVFDAVLWDGRVVDFGLRGLQNVPDHVLSCISDVAWNTPFPEHDKAGELRLQRVIDVDGRRRPTNGDKP